MRFKSFAALTLATGTMCGALTPTWGADKAHHNHAVQGPFDLSIANESRLIQMLKKGGKIPQNASLEQATEFVSKFLAERQQQEIKKLTETSAQAEANFHKHWGKNPKLKKHYRKFKKILNRLPPAPIQLETYTGEVKTAKVLALLIEFPDFPHNSIIPESTDMYYEDYNAAHFSDLLFSDSGYTGPGGEQGLVSMKQFYEAQSGGAYSVEGAVAGWYMASQPAAYYGNNETGNDRQLVQEALLAADADPNINLGDYDIEDRYDLDGDGDYWEADGLVDHIMVFHSSVGEEAGGGQLGEDAIWSHRWNLGGVMALPNSPATVPYWGGVMAAYDYTMQPASGAGGVVTHEYAHDLGLPDEYDTAYSGRGEPVATWSIMSSGSWAGVIPGTEPTGFGAYMKEELQRLHGGNWLKAVTVNAEDLTKQDDVFLVDQAVSKGHNHDAIRVDLPPRKNITTVPTVGEFAYFSGSDSNLLTSMTANVDLTTTTSASFTFDLWYDIETDWDYGYVTVYTEDGSATNLASTFTTETNPNGQNLGNGITGKSNDWIRASFDLSAFAGQQVQVAVEYVTDGYVDNPGMYIDNIQLIQDGNVVLDDQEETLFTLNGFSVDPGFDFSEHYYLVEWRTHKGVDKGLAHVNVAGQLMEYNEGMLIWYVDKYYVANHVGVHPGYGFVGVVDADQELVRWNDGSAASTRYQIHDATFNVKRSPELVLDFTDTFGISLEDKHTRPYKAFKDKKSYLNEEIPDAGKYLTEYGIRIKLWSHSWDKTVSKIGLSRKKPK